MSSRAGAHFGAAVAAGASCSGPHLRATPVRARLPWRSGVAVRSAAPSPTATVGGGSQQAAPPPPVQLHTARCATPLPPLLKLLQRCCGSTASTSSTSAASFGDGMPVSVTLCEDAHELGHPSGT